MAVSDYPKRHALHCRGASGQCAAVNDALALHGLLALLFNAYLTYLLVLTLELNRIVSKSRFWAKNRIENDRKSKFVYHTAAIYHGSE